MREGHTNQSSTAPPLQVKANSLFRNILPPSPFASRFWRFPPHISNPQPIENRYFGESRQKKDEICPLLGSEPGKVVEGRTTQFSRLCAV